MRTLLLLACFAVLGCGVVTSASAGLPPPPNGTIPSVIPILGRSSSGVPDPRAEATVIVRDLANNPVSGAMVVLDFSACSELKLCADAHEPGVFVDCATHTVRRLTDATGSAVFRVTGWSTAPPGAPGAPYRSAKVYADGVFFGSANAAIYDLDTGGLGAADLSRWLSDFFSSNNPARDDYDDSGSVGPNDLSMWLKAYFASGSITNCTPEGPCP